MNDEQESTINVISSRSYQLGIIAGLEKAADMLSAIAGIHFRGHRDVLSRSTRELADQLTVEATEKRKTYDEAGSQDVEAAWAKLNGWLETDGGAE